MSSTPINCSFCGRAKEEVDVLIAGVTGHICDNCIEQADNILQEERKDTPERADFQLKLPKEIKAHLDEYVIGQEEAKKTISVGVYNHFKRIVYPAADDAVETDKSNVIQPQLMTRLKSTNQTLFCSERRGREKPSLLGPLREC